MDTRSDVSPDFTAASIKVLGTVDIHRYIALFRRHLRLLVSIAALVFIASTIATFQLPKKYTASSEVMLDEREQKVTDVQQVLSGIPADTTAVDTEVEVLKSRELAEKVAAALNLDKDPEFNTALRPKSFVQTLFGKPSQLDNKTNLQQHNRVVDRVVSGLKVSRVGLTYVIRIDYTSSFAEKAANIANSYADHYLLEQLDAKFDATRRASDWLNSRLNGLKAQVEQAESAVNTYKANHGLLGIMSPAGTTISQQEVSNLNTQLAAAKAQEAETEANLTTAKQQLARGSSGDDLGASLNSQVINQLRQQRAQISSQVADMAGRLGPRHPDMLKAQRELADIDAQIQSEIARVTSNLEAQVQVSRQRTASIESSLASSRGNLAANGAASVALNDLQRNADSLSALYQSYLDRFKQTSNQQGLEQSDSRVVSRAKIPTAPSFPKRTLNAVLAMILSLAAALGGTFLVETFDSGIYTSEDVESTLGLAHLGSIPALATIVDKSETGPKVTSPTRYVIDRPLSSFAEAFRNLKTSLMFARLGQTVKVVAVTSALPGEGKTTTCICLGRVIAMGGQSVVIVDCDLRRRTVNRLFEEEPTVGLLEVLAGTASLDEALIFDAESGAHFLPLAKSAYSTKDVFYSAAADELLEKLRTKFDIVLLDTAPILPVADTKVLAPKADAILFLAQWKKTPRKAIENALRQLSAVGGLTVGIGLTQVDMKEQARSGYGDASYYYRSYKSYYS